MPSIPIAHVARNPLVHQDWLDDQCARLTSAEHVFTTRKKASIRASRNYWAS